jgi:hypothetical protein
MTPCVVAGRLFVTDSRSCFKFIIFGDISVKRIEFEKALYFEVLVPG